jgi:hypothetical protein
MPLSENFHPEWGYLVSAPSFMRTVRVAVVSTAIGTTAGMVVAISLISGSNDVDPLIGAYALASDAPVIRSRAPATPLTNVTTEVAPASSRAPSRRSDADTPSRATSAATASAVGSVNIPNRQNGMPSSAAVRAPAGAVASAEIPPPADGVASTAVTTSNVVREHMRAKRSRVTRHHGRAAKDAMSDRRHYDRGRVFEDFHEPAFPAAGGERFSGMRDEWRW